ncbi:sigma factor [Micromonospora sp. M12]
MTTEAAEAAGALQAHRPMLLGLAYRLLGSRHDAEDVLQEAYLRWLGVDRSKIDEPRRYLSRVVTRLALDRLRTRQAARETYVGTWLPEPVPTTPSPFGPLDRVELRDSLSIALLHVLERLTRRSGRCTSCTRPSTCHTRRSPRSWTGPSTTVGNCTTGRPHGYGRSSVGSPPAARSGSGCWTRSSPPPETATWRR